VAKELNARLKAATKAAFRDGRSDAVLGVLPRPVPSSLSKLLAAYTWKAHVLYQEWNADLVVLQTSVRRASEKVEQVKKQVEATKPRIDSSVEWTQEEVDRGEVSTAPGGRVAEQRSIKTGLYIILLIALAVGEFFVTRSAVTTLLDDEGLVANLVVASLAILSVTVAHIIGMTFKKNTSITTPMPPSTITFVTFLMGIVIVLAIFLSAIRAKPISAEANWLGLGPLWFSTLLFFFIQVTFIVTAAFLSYFHHSEHHEQKGKLAAELLAAEQLLATLEDELRAHESTDGATYDSLGAEYKLVAAEYVRGYQTGVANPIMDGNNGQVLPQIPEWPARTVLTLEEVR